MQRLRSPADFSVYMLDCANTDLHENSIPAAQKTDIQHKQIGAADNRNLDLVHAKHALYQLSYNPET